MEYLGKIKFYDEEMEVLFPEDFSLFRKKISEMVGLTEEDFLKTISMFYNDEEGDSISIRGKDDYKFFINFLKENKPQDERTTLNLEIKEKSDALIRKLTKELINYKEKNSEEINIEKKNSLEISKELKEIKNDNKEEKEINEINNEHNKNINIINNIDNNKDDEKYIEIDKINNPNNNIDNKINNENNLIPQNNNIQNQFQYKYEEKCKYCELFPLYDVFYYCVKCNIVMCSNCETELGSQHPHPFFKIQTIEQYNNSGIKFRKKTKNFFDGIGSGIQNLIGNVNNMINNSVGNINNNINRNNNRRNNNAMNDNKDYKALTQTMKSMYDLSNFTDEKIEEVLRLSNGDFDKALEYLAN